MMQQRHVGGSGDKGGLDGSGVRPRVGAALARVDAFGVAEWHLQQRTGGGAAVSLVGIALMVVLFANEMAHFVSPGVDSVMGVDMQHAGEETLAVNLKLRFPSLPCELLSIDTLDISGGHETNADAHMEKTRLGADGAPLAGADARYMPEPAPQRGLPLNAAAGDAMVRRATGALQRGEGCAVSGHLDVARVAGNFHASVHAQSLAVLQSLLSAKDQHGHSGINMSHVIDTLSFGPEYPGVVNPLDGAVRNIEDDTDLHGSTKYFLKLVPTTYVTAGGAATETNQFSVTEYFSPPELGSEKMSLPGVYFVYDVSPIAVTLQEKRRSIGHLLSRLCAVIGGTFAVTGMLSQMVGAALTKSKPSEASGSNGGHS